MTFLIRGTVLGVGGRGGGVALTERLVGDQVGQLFGTAEVEEHCLVGGHDLLRGQFEPTIRLGFRPLFHPAIMALATAGSNLVVPGYNHDAGMGPGAGDVRLGGAMSRKQHPELDLTDSGELVSAMSAAVGRLRQLAVAAFNSCDGFGGGVVFELGAVELGVAAAQGEQLGVGAVFGDPAILDDDDGVRGPDGGQPVRDDQRRPAG